MRGGRVAARDCPRLPGGSVQVRQQSLAGGGDHKLQSWNGGESQIGGSLRWLMREEGSGTAFKSSLGPGRL